MSQQREALTKAHGLTERAIAVAEKANAMCKEAIAERDALREENRRLREALLKVTRFIQPSMHARNWEAAETLDEARALLRELGERA